VIELTFGKISRLGDKCKVGQAVRRGLGCGPDGRTGAVDLFKFCRVGSLLGRVNIYLVDNETKDAIGIFSIGSECFIVLYPKCRPELILRFYIGSFRDIDS